MAVAMGAARTVLTHFSARYPKLPVLFSGMFFMQQQIESIELGRTRNLCMHSRVQVLLVLLLYL